MDDIPARFTTDLLEDDGSGGGGSNGGGLTVPQDQRSVSSRSTQRRWDDPPEEEPEVPVENETTMVFVKRFTARPLYEAEIMHLAFTPADSHVAAMVPRAPNATLAHPDAPCTLVVWSAADGQRLPIATLGTSHGIRIHGGFAFRPAAADLVVACPFLRDTPIAGAASGTVAVANDPRFEVYDLGRRCRRLKADLPVQAPVAWSHEGDVLAAASSRDPSRIVVVPRGGGGGRAQVARVLLAHTDAVTQLAFAPAAAGPRPGALVSAGRDGYVRVTDVASGRTLQRIEVGAGRAAAPSLLRVSPDGALVATVWGRDVVLWHLDTGRVRAYSLTVVRPAAEGWPLCISPDCRYLACRTEDGFDVSDLDTGRFRGEFARSGPTVTAAAFDSTGTRLAVGDFAGNLEMFEVVTA